MNWIKTETGYAADGYTLTRTPGKRWLVKYGTEVLADGKHFTKLADAKQIAEDRVKRLLPSEPVADIIATATDIAANLTPEQAQAGMAEVMGVEDSSDPSPPKTGTGSVPSAEPTRTTAATATTQFLGSPKTVQVTDTLGGNAQFCRPIVRESLTDQFTRLAIYKDIGIARRYLRESA